MQQHLSDPLGADSPADGGPGQPSRPPGRVDGGRLGGGYARGAAVTGPSARSRAGGRGDRRLDRRRYREAGLRSRPASVGVVVRVHCAVGLNAGGVELGNAAMPAGREPWPHEDAAVVRIGNFVECHPALLRGVG